jgi:DNA-binding PadR family transcriptional regulator
MTLEDIVLAVLSKFSMLSLEELVAVLILLREEGRVMDIPQPRRPLSIPQLIPTLEGLISRGLVAIYEEMESNVRKYVITRLGASRAEKIKIPALDEIAKKYSFQYVPLPLVVALRYPQYF